MNLPGLLPESADDRACSEVLRLNGLDVPHLSKYSITDLHPGLLFGFTSFEPRTIRNSLEEIARIIRKTRAIRLNKAG